MAYDGISGTSSVIEFGTGTRKRRTNSSEMVVGNIFRLNCTKLMLMQDENVDLFLDALRREATFNIKQRVADSKVYTLNCFAVGLRDTIETHLLLFLPTLKQSKANNQITYLLLACKRICNFAWNI